MSLIDAALHEVQRITRERNSMRSALEAIADMCGKPADAVYWLAVIRELSLKTLEAK
jgi:hypothetical protein